LSLAWSGPDGPLLSWRRAWFTLPLLGLLVVDRVEYLRFGEGASVRTRLAFVGVRLLLCATYALGTADGGMLLFLLPLVPYFVFVYVGKRWALVALGVSFAPYANIIPMLAG